MEKPKEILWLSISIPYDAVDHAGGKTHNFYIKQFNADDDFNIKLVTFCEKKDFGKSDLEKYHLEADICYLDSDIRSRISKKIWNIESTLNPFTRYANAMSNYRVKECLKRVRKLYRKDYKPDIVILHWTPLALLSKKLRRHFPHAKIIAIEEDVMFQNYARRYQIEKDILLKWFYYIRYHQLKRIELSAMMNADLVYVNNNKDYDLLSKNGIVKQKIRTLIPYYDQYFYVNRKNSTTSKDILFYGAMSRRENYTSVIWFIQNVFSKIGDKTVRLIIAGSHPHKSLDKFQSDRIIITGFIENVSVYFEKCMCLIVPLLYGAGIKVKVLEGFSAGIPILTNDIGIEGIGAVASEEYYHCQCAQDYINVIRQIISDRQTASQIGENGRKFVRRNFDYNVYAEIMIRELKEL